MITKHFPNGYTITTTGEDFVGCFEQMAALQDIFESCPVDGSDGDFWLIVRDVQKDGEDYRYYELMDKKTKYRRPLHVYKQKDKKGLMYVTKKDKDGNWLDNGGWNKPFEKKEGEAKTNVQTPAKGEGKAKKGKDVAAETPF